LNPGRQAVQFMRITVEEAFARWAGFDLFDSVKKGDLEAQAHRLGLDLMDGLDTAALYDVIFIHAVEPRLREEGFVALMDYPAFVPCLAKNNGRTTERWELYACGIELANCFSEETDPLRVRAFFKSEAAAKEKTALTLHCVDNDYWKIFMEKDGQGFPRCSGVAMGLDRLIMYLCGKSHIGAVLPFV